MEEYPHHKNVTPPESAEALIKDHLFFALLQSHDIKALAKLMTREEIEPNTIIVKEDEVLDRIYLIESGKAKVFREHKTLARTIVIEAGHLTKGNSIGLATDTFFSITGFRTATVIAETPMVVYSIPFKPFLEFLTSSSGRYPALIEASNRITLVNVFKAMTDASVTSHQRIQTLISRGRQINIPAKTTFIRKDDPIIYCYIILQGEVEITSSNTPPRVMKQGDVLSGKEIESKKFYIATATALTDCLLFRIAKKHFRVRKKLSFFKKMWNRFKNWFYPKEIKK